MTDPMTIKGCPFCGEQPQDNTKIKDAYPKIYCKNLKCFFTSYSISTLEEWNTRHKESI